MKVGKDEPLDIDLELSLKLSECGFKATAPYLFVQHVKSILGSCSGD